MNTEKWKILLLDDDEDDYILLREMLDEIRSSAYHLVWVPTISEGVEKIRGEAWDAVLVDFDLGLENGITFIQTALESGFRRPLIMITGRGSYDLDVQAMQAGAADYISKTMLNPPLLERVIRYAIEHTNSEARLDEMVHQRTVQLENALEELRVAEEELRQRNESIQKAFQKNLADEKLRHELEKLLPGGRLITSAEGVIKVADENAALLLNTPSNALVGRPLVSFIAASDRAQFGRKFVHICQSGALFNLQMKIQPVNKAPVSACLTALCHSSGPDNEPPVIHWLVHHL